MQHLRRAEDVLGRAEDVLGRAEVVLGHGEDFLGREEDDCRGRVEGAHRREDNSEESQLKEDTSIQQYTSPRALKA